MVAVAPMMSITLFDSLLVIVHVISWSPLVHTVSPPRIGWCAKATPMNTATVSDRQDGDRPDHTQPCAPATR